MQVNAYLFFNGQCEEALNFYAKSLGGKIEGVHFYEGSPTAGHVPPEFLKKIMHARLVIGDQVIMASDAPPDRSQHPQGFSMSISLNDAAQGKRIFEALADNGNVQMPFQQTFWADGFGMLIDRFGIPWMVNCEKASESAATGANRV